MATVAQMEGLLPDTWDLLGLSSAYAACKAATFLLVRAMGYVSEVRYPGALRERLWSTVGYRSYFVQFYPGRGFSKNFLRHTVLHASVGAAATLALTKVWSPLRVRMACANKRAAEFASYAIHHPPRVTPLSIFLFFPVHPPMCFTARKEGYAAGATRIQ